MDILPELLFTKSKGGKKGYSFSFNNLPGSKIEISDSFLREEIKDFPELSEVELVRHYMNLSKLNHSVDNGFYPLGSCTMKYNPKINEKIAGMDDFNAHPYSPHDTVKGNLEIFHELENWLIKLTGMDTFTMSPSAGAHGEFCGMMTIRKYLSSRGDPRKVVLIPDSAHGTNPASSNFAGYDVKEIPSNGDGIIDPGELKKYLDKDVAALMMTNPNTLGIFEKNISEISDLLHKNGSLLYMDGANMNAFLGILKPGELGVDVLHLNLHKTFSTPHGGGGPGSGPVGVVKDLEEFLPVPKISKDNNSFKIRYFNTEGIGRIKNFYGNFLVILRALVYLVSLGKENIRKVAEDSVLNANYIRKRLEKYLDLPFTSKTLHEVVFSDHGLKIKTLDIAKRLLDYNIHPFTIYFPLIVHGAMMIEPTETESKETLDNFVDVMKTILDEAEKNPEFIKGAPYNTPLSRLDEVYAARNLILKWVREEEN